MPRITAAASDEPPPIPAAAGRCLSSAIVTGWSKGTAARQHRFDGSTGTPAAIGPVTCNDRLSAGVSVTRSPTSAKTTIESSR